MLTSNVVIWSPLLNFLVSFSPSSPPPHWCRLQFIRAPTSRSRAILPTFSGLYLNWQNTWLENSWSKSVLHGTHLIESNYYTKELSVLITVPDSDSASHVLQSTGPLPIYVQQSAVAKAIGLAQTIFAIALTLQLFCWYCVVIFINIRGSTMIFFSLMLH